MAPPANSGARPAPPFKHSEEIALKHQRFCEHTIEAINRLIGVDKTQGVFSCQTTASPAQSEIVFGRSGAQEKPRVQFTLGHHELLGKARELGCRYAYFIPQKCRYRFMPDQPLPNPIPSDWIEMGTDINTGPVDGTYLFGVPEQFSGLTGAQGTLVMRPNTSNEILRENYRNMLAAPENYPLDAAVISMGVPEHDIVTPRPPYPGANLTPEQGRCVGFCALNPVTMIWGPPGTGKSVTLCGILSYALAHGLRVLILATANDALDSIAEKVYKIYTSGKDPNIVRLVEAGMVTRYGSSPRAVNYPEISYSSREKFARATKKTPPTVSESMAKDAVTFSTFFRFLHLRPSIYDMVLIDEVGFVNIPTIYAAAAVAAKKVVMCGDPRQNTPIFTYKPQDVGNAAAVLFKRDIYRHNKLRIDVGDAPDPRLCALSTQYRMDDRIAEAVRITNLYPRYASPEDGRTISTSETVALACHPLPGEALVVVDTGNLHPRAAGNYNQTHFEMIKLATASALQRANIGGVGIVAPYRKQADAYHHWILDNRLGRCRAGTVHKFQGSEAPLVFFDTVEAQVIGDKPNSHYFTDEIKHGAETINNLNVAVSRAKAKLVVVADVRYILDNLSPGCYLHRLFAHVGEKGHIVDAEVFLGQIGRRLGEKADDSAYFSKSPDLVSAPELFPVLGRDIVAARQTLDLFSRHFDRQFFMTLLDKVAPKCRQSGMTVNFYIGHRFSHEDKLFIEKAIDAVPFFYRFRPTDWKFGKDTFAVFDNRVYYQSVVSSEINILKGELPYQSARFVFSAGEKKA